MKIQSKAVSEQKCLPVKVDKKGKEIKDRVTLGSNSVTPDFLTEPLISQTSNYKVTATLRRGAEGVVYGAVLGAACGAAGFGASMLIGEAGVIGTALIAGGVFGTIGYMLGKKNEGFLEESARIRGFRLGIQGAGAVYDGSHGPGGILEAAITSAVMSGVMAGAKGYIAGDMADALWGNS